MGELSTAAGAAQAAAAVPLWPTKAPALEGVKSKLREVLWAEPLFAKREPLALRLTGRVAAAGLTAKEAEDLLTDLSGNDPESGSDAKTSWHVRRHGGLRVAALRSGSSLEGAAATRPHIVVAAASALWDRGEVFDAVRSFPGAVLLVFDGPPPRAGDVPPLLVELGIGSQWRIREEKAQAQMLHDVLVHGPNSPDLYPEPWLEELVEEQLGPLYLEEFAADLPNLRRTQRGYGAKLSLLVEPSESSEVPKLLGFLMYKPWGSPRPGVSICAVGVASDRRGHGLGRVLMDAAEAAAAAAGMASGGVPGAVVLSSLSTAVGFYERIGYERLDGGPAEEDCDDCVPMRRLMDPLAIGGAPLGDLEKWTPRRAKHLEDGPTWMAIEELLLPPSAAA